MSRAGGRLALAASALALTLIVTWPLGRCFAVCLGASQDPLVSVYLLRWVGHALATPGVRLLDAGIFAPYPRTLALGEAMPLVGVATFPALRLTGNPVVAHNAGVVLAYTLAALGAAALAARLLGPTPAALLAGLVFAYAPRLLHQAHNLQTLAAACWLPWAFLALERFLARPTWRAASLCAAAALGLALTSLTVFAFAGVAGVVFLASGALWDERRLAPPHLLRLAGVGGPAAALLAIHIAPYRTLAAQWGLERDLPEVRRYSASLGDYLGVPPEHLLHRLVGIGRVVDLDREALFPGLTVAALAAVGLAAAARDPAGLRRRLAPYLALAGAAAVLGFGPAVATPWGTIPLPYRILHAAVPGFTAIRTPRRFAGFVALGIALLAAAGAAWLAARLRARWRPAALAGLAAVILLESVGVPFPGAVRRLDAAALPPVYGWLATQDARTVVLELPMDEDWEKVGAAAFHLRPTVNGWSSYLPPHYLALAAAMASFPDPRSLALIHAARPDVVVVERRWLDAARAAAVAARPAALALERAVGDRLVYRLGPSAGAGLERLEATATWRAGSAGPRRDVCLRLRNPAADFVPLYPLRRLTLTVEADGRLAATVVRWLPLDLAPAATHSECVGLSGEPSLVRLRGEIEGAGRRHRVTVAPADAPQRVLPAG